MCIAVPDLVTNSYFPALAAEELGYHAAEGLEVHIELLAPAPWAMAALRDGRVDAVAAGAHTTGGQLHKNAISRASSTSPL